MLQSSRERALQSWFQKGDRQKLAELQTPQAERGLAAGMATFIGVPNEDVTVTGSNLRSRALLVDTREGNVRICRKLSFRAESLSFLDLQRSDH